MELGLIRIVVQRVIRKGHVRTMGCPNNCNSEQDGIRNPMYISKYQGLQEKEYFLEAEDGGKICFIEELI